MAEEKTFELHLTAGCARVVWDALQNCMSKGRVAMRINRKTQDIIKEQCMNVDENDNGSFKEGTIILNEDQYDSLNDCIEYRVNIVGVPGVLVDGYLKLFDEMEKHKEQKPVKQDKPQVETPKS
jgi:hypothetical protein